jgi:hypothetical protein
LELYQHSSTSFQAGRRKVANVQTQLRAVEPAFIIEAQAENGGEQ